MSEGRGGLEGGGRAAVVGVEKMSQARGPLQELNQAAIATAAMSEAHDPLQVAKQRSRHDATEMSEARGPLQLPTTAPLAAGKEAARDDQHGTRV